MLALSMALPSFLLLAAVSSTPLSPQKDDSSSSFAAFSENSFVEWTTNDTFITFTINSTSGGWFLFGWMKQRDRSAAPKKLSQTRADVLVFYPSRALDCNTLRDKGKLHKDKDQNDLIIEHNKKDTVWKVTRRLDTGNKLEDVAIEPGSMLAFGAEGNTSIQHLKDLNPDAVDSRIKFTSVHFLAENPEAATPENSTDKFTEFLGTIIKEHWVAVIVGSATIATACITLVVYCCFRKKKASKNKKVKVSFFKEEGDLDEEARVALISTT